MVSITRHVFIYIFQTEEFLAVRFVMDYEKNYLISFDTRIFKATPTNHHPHPHPHTQTHTHSTPQYFELEFIFQHQM